MLTLRDYFHRGIVAQIIMFFKEISLSKQNDEFVNFKMFLEKKNIHIHGIRFCALLVLYNYIRYTKTSWTD